MVIENAHLYALAQYAWKMTFLDSNLTINALAGRQVAGLCEYIRDNFVLNYTDVNM